jgi:hypothetical protein
MPVEVPVPATVRQLVANFIAFLETGEVAADLFAPDVFADVTLPTWRLQAADIDGLVAIRREGHPSTGRVTQHRVDLIPDGFVLEFSESWEQDGDEWSSREMMRASVHDGLIAEVSIYCTGDWNTQRVTEHAAAVTLLRP